MLPAVALALTVAGTPDPASQLAILARQYQAYDLPLPPKDADLYRLTRVRPDNSPDHRFWVEVGFALAVSPHGKPTRVLVGLGEEDWYTGDDYLEATLTAANWNGLTSRGRWNEPILAAQCESLGRHELAMAVWGGWRKNGGTAAEARFTVAQRGWEWWVKRFQHHGADRAKVARRLQLIALDRPVNADADLLRRLKLSLEPTAATPGSVEALIDELLDVSVFPEYSFREDRDPTLSAILRLGFEAVPALIDHLDDDRLTRSRTASECINWDFRRSYPYSVKHFARDFLFGYMAHPNAERNRIDGKLLAKKDALTWWAEAKREGEEAYCLRQLVEDWPNEYLLGVVAEKFPKRLPEVFAELKKRVDLSSTDIGPFVSELVRSSLPAATKKKVLLGAVEINEDDWQAEALAGLRHVDVDEFHVRLVAVLGDLSPVEDRVKKERLESWSHICIASIAMLTDDAKVWAAVGKYLDSASTEVKIEWIEQLTWQGDETHKCYRRVVGCVAGRLDDDSVRVQRNGNDISASQVRDHAARRLGELLHLKTAPAEGWTADDWAAFRKEVATAAEKVAKR